LIAASSYICSEHERIFLKEGKRLLIIITIIITIIIIIFYYFLQFFTL
jgi:hypothetical protein